VINNEKRDINYFVLYRGAEMAWQGRNNHSSIPTWIAANTVTCFGNETRFQLCK